MFDVIVVAKSGAGAYRYYVEEVAGKEQQAPLPGGYCECGEGYRANELVVAPAEGVVRNFYSNFPFMYVDKNDTVAYYSKVGFTWLVQGFICLVLFVAILYLQKRKDVI